MSTRSRPSGWGVLAGDWFLHPFTLVADPAHPGLRKGSLLGARFPPPPEFSSRLQRLVSPQMSVWDSSPPPTDFQTKTIAAEALNPGFATKRGFSRGQLSASGWSSPRQCRSTQDPRERRPKAVLWLVLTNSQKWEKYGGGAVAARAPSPAPALH